GRSWPVVLAVPTPCGPKSDEPPSSVCQKSHMREIDQCVSMEVGDSGRKLGDFVPGGSTGRLGVPWQRENRCAEYTISSRHRDGHTAGSGRRIFLGHPGDS